MNHFIFTVKQLISSIAAILCFFSGINYDLHGTSLIFHHEGHTIPAYTEVALRQAAYFNPTMPIYVLTNYMSVKCLQQVDLPKNVHLVRLDKLPKSHLHQAFEKKKQSFYQSRFFLGLKDLNWFCYDRFFSLYDFLLSTEITKVFLLENDVLTYCEFDPITQHLEEIDIGFTAMSESLIICGISYFKNLKSVETLCRFILDYFDPETVDMAFWPKFKKAFPDIAHDLPVMTPAEFDRQKVVASDHFKPLNLFDQLNSIFDHAAYGQYLCPGDGCKIFINRSCAIDPSLLTYRWAHDLKGRKCPFIVSKDHPQAQMVKINNLHVHSKNLKSYKSYP